MHGVMSCHVMTCKITNHIMCQANRQLEQQQAFASNSSTSLSTSASSLTLTSSSRAPPLVPRSSSTTQLTRQRSSSNVTTKDTSEKSQLSAMLFDHRNRKVLQRLCDEMQKSGLVQV